MIFYTICLEIMSQVTYFFSNRLFGIIRELEDRKYKKRKKGTKGRVLWFWSTGRVAMYVGTISEPWWLTACSSCRGKNSSPLRHVANAWPALASASTDLFTTCCRTISRHPVLFCQYIPEQFETIKVCVRGLTNGKNYVFAYIS